MTEKRTSGVVAFIPPTLGPENMRKAELHISALSEDEYKAYTAHFKEIRFVDPGEIYKEWDDATDDLLNISVRDARLWLRGKFGTLSIEVNEKVYYLLFIPFSFC